jgi:hypothetical protein
VTEGMELSLEDPEKFEGLRQRQCQRNGKEKQLKKLQDSKLIRFL